MATGKKLKDIAVSHAPGQVGLSFTYDVGPRDHMILSIPVLDILIQRLTDARSAATTTGDSVSVSDHVQVRIGT